MRAWDNYWYAPVAAIRPYLLFKGFLLILALDICLLMVKEGHWYGLGGFNIAHFPVLDAVQPLPSPAIYIGTMLLAASTLSGFDSADSRSASTRASAAFSRSRASSVVPRFL